MATDTNVRLPFRHHSFPFLIPSPVSDFAGNLGLPAISQNLFQRLIRNPRLDSTNAKERECSEMLCSLLQNAPMIARRIFAWMAGRVEFDSRYLNDLTFVIDTEQPIGTKRDDLRIIGWKNPNDMKPHLIWTVEIKVGATFHHSSSQMCAEDAAIDEPVDEDSITVNQLLNYDNWLAVQPVEHRAGFVLAIQDRSSDLPTALKCRWIGLSWTMMGEHIAAAISEGNLPEGEALLGRHVLGFITEHLWRTSEMSESRLDFNDVALIRAFSILAKECENRINLLVESLVQILMDSGIGHGEVTHSPSLFRNMGCSYISRTLANDSIIGAGIGGDADYGDYISVWIETPAKHSQKQAFKNELKKLADALRKKNPRWTLPSQNNESGWDAWDDVVLVAPLAVLLTSEDQRSATQGIVRYALKDLKDTGVIDAFKKTIGNEPKTGRKKL